MTDKSSESCPFSGEYFKLEVERYGIRTPNGIAVRNRRHFDLCPICLGVPSECKPCMQGVQGQEAVAVSGSSP